MRPATSAPGDTRRRERHANQHGPEEDADEAGDLEFVEHVHFPLILETGECLPEDTADVRGGVDPFTGSTQTPSNVALDVGPVD
jgi:hypothetical protein